MTVQEVVSTCKDVVIAISAAVTTIVAVKGLDRWARELRGKAHFDAARNLAKATYRLRNDVRNLRAPFISIGEFPEGYDSRDGPAIVAGGFAHVYGNRWAPVLVSAREFEAASLEAEALWGADLRAATEAVLRCLNRLRAFTDTYIGDKANNGADFRHNPDLKAEVEDAIWAIDRQGNPNAFGAELDGAIRQIELLLKPHLAR